MRSYSYFFVYQIIVLATVRLADTYKLCNPAFAYSSAFNPRRQLSKPAIAVRRCKLTSA